jgi:hypothetical protein
MAVGLVEATATVSVECRYGEDCPQVPWEQAQVTPRFVMAEATIFKTQDIKKTFPQL